MNMQPDEISQAKALNKALLAARAHTYDGEYLVIVDFTQPSYKKRFFVYSMVDKKIIREHHCSHGSGSAGRDPAYCDKFSNVNMSKKSSLGSMKTGGVYYGKHGRSLKLHGLEEGVNNNVYSRSIVIHSARYVTDNYILKNGRAGCSWGCFALDPAICNDVIDLVKGGTFLYSYYK